MDDTLRVFRDIFTGIYDFAVSMEFETLGIKFNLWQLYILGLVAGICLFLLYKWIN